MNKDYYYFMGELYKFSNKDGFERLAKNESVPMVHIGLLPSDEVE